MLKLIGLGLICGFLVVAVSGQGNVSIRDVKLYNHGFHRLLGGIGGIQFQQGKITAEVTNTNTDRAIVEVDIQLDLADPVRRVKRDRLYLKLKSRLFSKAPIKPGKKQTYEAETGGYELPGGCENVFGYTVYPGECISDLKINRVVFSDGSLVERPGWRDEQSPNGP